MTEQKLTYAERMRSDGKYPIVLRFASLQPKDVAGVIGHAERRIGDLSHIDFSRTHLNRILVGSNDIAEEVMEECRAMSLWNYQSNIIGLSKNRGKKDVRRARERGLQDPWTLQKKLRGPLREGVLTLHRDFFKADENTPDDKRLEFIDDEGNPTAFDVDKCNEFVDAGMAFLSEEFGLMMPYARADFDEQSVHIQFVIVDVVEEPASVRYAYGRQLFRTSHHPMIGGDGEKKGYEIAQDRAGEFFARPEHSHMNIVRAEARAAKKREVAQSIAAIAEQVDEDAFFGLEEKIPNGSENAKAMYLLKKKMAEAIETKGSADKVRKDTAATLALDYLEALGVVKPEDRHEASTRRARTALLSQYEDTYGTAAEIIEKPELAAEKALDGARKRILAAERIAAEKRAERDLQATIERARLEKELREKAEAEEARREKQHQMKMQEIAEREAKVETREVEVKRKESELTKMLKEVLPLVDSIKDAARRLGVLAEPFVGKAIDAGKKLKGYFDLR